MSEDAAVISVNDLHIRFMNRSTFSGRKAAGNKYNEALKGISLTVNKGDTYGIIGETGSGKSTLAKILLGIYKPTDGSVEVNGKHINFKRTRDIRFMRNQIGIVFQDPVGSLNPRLPVYKIIRAGLLYSDIPKEKYEERIREVSLLTGVPVSKLWNYPGELSGGEKQRVSLARALAAPKKALILDEPTSSLDVSIQAEILNLLRDLKKKTDLTYLFISHDISVIKYMCNRLSVMFYGKIVESGNTREVASAPSHPYSEILFRSTFSLDKKGDMEIPLAETASSSSGCIFQRQCVRRYEPCSQEPPSVQLPFEEHVVSCWLYHKDGF